MPFSLRIWSLVCVALALTAPAMTGCAVHRRVYDPYSRQYAPWANERGYYNQWEDQSHRQHRSFQRRNEEEQREYWEWRHRQDPRRGNHDRDDDRH